MFIHGLFDSPFTLRDMANQLRSEGALCRSVLLPGHGTKPADLLQVNYHDWLNTVKYGVASLKNEVEQIFLVGYSTGAALAIHQAIHDPDIKGLVLIAPVMKVKWSVNLIMGWRRFIKFIMKRKPWAYYEDEIDYVKYHSIAFHPVTQVHQLTQVIDELNTNHPIKTKLLMILSEDDETISSSAAMEFFTQIKNPENKAIYYTTQPDQKRGERIIGRSSVHSSLHIKNFSHIASVFSPNNLHYGKQGDYIHASHNKTKEYIYGGYNRLVAKISGLLYEMGLTRRKHRELTYNPDFNFMMETVSDFIFNTNNK